FDPKRFINERLHKYLVRKTFIFLPFSGGSRICLGQRVQASFILIRVLHAFSELYLAFAAQPPESRIPDDWKTDAEDLSGRKRHEKIQPKNRFKLFVKRAV
ncbi:hypothetical protein DFH09DRAFT_930447, partial [Mycena vulgaris]